jgi:uncharacterized protein YcbX
MSEIPVGAVGTVGRVQRYPLKSADGEELDKVMVGTAGLEDDRRWALEAPDGTAVTAKSEPRLRDVRARSVDGALQLSVDLQDLVGEGVHVVDAPGTNQQIAAVHLVSSGAHAAADAPSGCDPQPRANLVLELTSAGAERGWVGRRLRVGEVELEVTRTPSSCLGVYAEVLRPGVIARGDAVELLD